MSIIGMSCQLAEHKKENAKIQNIQHEMINLKDHITKYGSKQS